MFCRILGNCPVELPPTFLENLHSFAQEHPAECLAGFLITAALVYGIYQRFSPSDSLKTHRVFINHQGQPNTLFLQVKKPLEHLTQQDKHEAAKAILNYWKSFNVDEYDPEAKSPTIQREKLLPSSDNSLDASSLEEIDNQTTVQFIIAKANAQSAYVSIAQINEELEITPDNYKVARKALARWSVSNVLSLREKPRQSRPPIPSFD